MNFIITLLLKATICLVLSTLLYFSAKKASASLRHWIVSLSLVGLLVLPFSSTILPEWQVETEVAQLLPASGKPTSNLTAIPTGTSSARPSEEVSAKAAQAVRPTSNLELHMISTSSSSPDAKMSLLQIVVILWAVGSFVFLFRLVIGIRATYQLNQKAIPARGHASSPGVNIAYHPSIKSPMTWGVWKPRILLPEHAKTWSE
ncbi:MAG: hypothetical protein KTR30_07795 [Saprospiraceae bacterium]|nr:hypothetical protein [Saprospiraceae bacterium]